MAARAGSGYLNSLALTIVEPPLENESRACRIQTLPSTFNATSRTISASGECDSSSLMVGESQRGNELVRLVLVPRKSLRQVVAEQCISVQIKEFTGGRMTFSVQHQVIWWRPDFGNSGDIFCEGSPGCWIRNEPIPS